MPIEVKLDSPAGRAEITKGVSPLIRKVVLDIEAEIKRSMASGKSGKTYGRGKARTSTGRRVKKRRTHRASAPGQAPAIDTGNLVNSIRSMFPKPLGGELNIGAFYASFLEFGTRKMRARPFVVPAIDTVTDKLKNV